MLKIFTSYTPGAGKSYLMLQRAIEERKSGKKVFIGYFNRKHRDMSKLPWKEDLKKCSVSIKKKEDIDFIVKENPDIVVMDEMGMQVTKNTFVYHIIEVLLENQIDVYTSANLKRFQSINPLFRKISGIGIRTTIPDCFLDIAEEIIFVDRRPELMKEDFESGKLFGDKYMKSKIMRKNFCLENLISYRELSIEYLKRYNNIEIIQRHE
ncbi:hypothetical protein [uncultured Eubacterium sp.]|uniref:hypothetical protein n=1 Tax=uncultured Eubacterium sp. TaxID=165185 RepID=UPI00267289F2|nr:hypothetical protein [uncultured Eubacterium sp.]